MAEVVGNGAGMSNTVPSVGLTGVRVARARHLAGVEIARAAVAARSFPVHVSPGLGICVKSGDSHRVVADGRRMDYPRDAVCLRPPGCIWESHKGRHGFVSVDLTPDLVEEVVGEMTTIARARMSFVARRAAPDLPRLVKALERADSRFEVESLVAGLVIGLSDLGALPAPAAERSPASRRRTVAVARDHLEAYLHLRPSLDDTARAAGTDKFTLLREFRRELGTTPHAYLVMLRLARAQLLLGEGQPAAQAASDAGFADQAHLGRWFRRVYGVSPVSYASSVRPAISFQTEGPLR